MTDQMETRKRKLINVRPIDFILDEDDDVGGDNCNDVAHIEQEIFLTNSCANCGTFVYIPCIIARRYRPSTYDSFYICLHLNWNSGDALRQKNRFVHNNCDNVFWIGACVLAFYVLRILFYESNRA